MQIPIKVHASPLLQAWGVTVLRVVIGLVFLVHGSQKLFVTGMTGVAGFMTQTGVPLPMTAAVVVTAIEVLNPSNKVPGPARQGYKSKQRDYLAARVNLVEIDLVRSGRRMPMVDPWPKSPYYLLVGREDHVPYCRVWPAYFHQPLPDPTARPTTSVAARLSWLAYSRYASDRFFAMKQEQTALMRAYIEPDLLVLDDLFLARRITDPSAELLQAVVHQRYKRRASIVVTSNRVVEDWGKYLRDATMGTTILDRLMHRAVMLEFEGKSYRLKEAAARIAPNTAEVH